MTRESGLKQQFFVIRELTSREIKRRYVRSYLGMVWSVLNPLLHMIVMTIIFSYMFRRSIENFPLYYLTGSIFWSFFSESTEHAMTALMDNKMLLIKAKLPKNTFVLSRVYTCLVNFGLSCIAYALILLFYRVTPSITMIVIIPALVLLMFFSLGIGYMLSILYVFFADIKYLYGIIKTFWYYLCAIFYPIDRLPEILQNVLGYNPVYLAIYITRCGVVYGKWPEPDAWIKLAIFAAVSYIIGRMVFKIGRASCRERV